ncbi:MAG: thioredoxin [Candidatus Borkfalkiaceae bacterium]|nr:thioredoxin [Christensenellaceae bacterium]
MEAVKIESSADFYNLINSEKVVLVDFYADWCGPCKMQSPIVDELAEEAGEKFTVAKLNTDKCTDVCIKYFVSSIPTIIVFKNGEAVEKSVGLTDKAELSDMLLKHI